MKVRRSGGSGVTLKIAVLLWVVFALVMVAAHSPYWKLPYYWDELGQFIPQALDLYQEGRWIPIHTTPNVHPPGVIAMLAVVWTVAQGHSIAATRIAMLIVAAFGVAGSFLLAIGLARRAPGAPAFAALALLLAAPLFYTQSMMAQLDMPAMVFTIWSLVMFLDRRYVWSAVFASVAVLAKETAIVLPAVLIAWLVFRERKTREPLYFLPPFLLLAAWIAYLWHMTGHPFGEARFAQYNTLYSLNPVRLIAAFFRRGFYLFVAEFRWIGTAALIWAWRKTDWFRQPDWALTGLFAIAHVAVVTAFGGAELERYLLPVLPILFAAFAIGFMSLRGTQRMAAIGVTVAGALVSMVWYPAYPFPFENNLAMTDFVGMHQLAAQQVSDDPSVHVVATAWPLTDALRRPEFGYVSRSIEAVETHDFNPANLVADRKPDAVLVYRREWRPGFLYANSALVRDLLRNYYEYVPQATSGEIEAKFGVHLERRWEHGGMWAELYRK